MLRDYGGVAELRQLAALVQKYQLVSPTFYNLLWQQATGGDTPREARVLSVVLLDRRGAFNDYRNCDLALGALERATGQRFHGEGKTVQDKDEAIAKGLVWLKAQGLVD